ncbi:hypothetical protein FKM82_009432 [Ascaphus truei]
MLSWPQLGPSFSLTLARPTLKKCTKCTAGFPARIGDLWITAPKGIIDAEPKRHTLTLSACRNEDKEYQEIPVTRKTKKMATPDRMEGSPAPTGSGGRFGGKSPRGDIRSPRRLATQ